MKTATKLQLKKLEAADRKARSLYDDLVRITSELEKRRIYLPNYHSILHSAYTVHHQLMTDINSLK